MILTLTLIGPSDNSYQYGWATFPSKAMTGHLKVRFWSIFHKNAKNLIKNIPKWPKTVILSTVNGQDF